MLLRGVLVSIPMLLIAGACQATPITIFTEPDFQGEKKTVLVRDCIVRLHGPFYGNISSINLHDGCVQLYNEPNCTGDYLIVKPESPAHENLLLWKLPSGEPAFDNKVESIGPCTKHEPCHDSRIRNIPINSTIQIYKDTSVESYEKDRGFTGDYEMIDLKAGCVPVNSGFNPYGAAIKFGSPNLCIEMYKYSNCTDPFPRRHSWSARLLMWPGHGWNNDIVRAVSLCDYNCPARTPENLLPNTCVPSPMDSTLVALQEALAAAQAALAASQTALSAALNRLDTTERIRGHRQNWQLKFLEMFKPPNPQNKDACIASVALKGLTMEIRNITDIVPKQAIFLMTVQSHKMAMASLIQIFKDQTSVSDLIETAKIIKDHPDINRKLYLAAILSVSLRVEELKFLAWPNLIQLMPDSFINYEALIVDKISKKPRHQQGCVVIDGTAGSDNGEENRLWYFREDLLVNAQHAYWHVSNLGKNLSKQEDRRGELFYFFHHQIIARYNAESLALSPHGFGRTRHFSYYEGYVVSEGYITHMSDFDARSDWADRLPNAVLKNVVQEEQLLNLIANDIYFRRLIAENGSSISIDNSGGINLLGETVEASIFSVNKCRYTLAGFHNTGHRNLAHLSGGTGIMNSPSVAMRDPLFYEWHAVIDAIFQHHNRLLTPYTPTEGEYPLIWAGVEILDLSVKMLNKDIKNELKTYFTNQTMNLTITGDIEDTEAQEYCITRLDHFPFQYEIVIDLEPEIGSSKGTVRLFLAPRFDELGKRFSMLEQRTEFFALDAFSVDLTIGENLIRRKSSDSHLLGQWSWRFEDNGTKDGNPRNNPFCGCGWPKHMLLPKGTSSGMKFDLFAMVTNGREDDNKEVPKIDDVCADSYMLCGILDKKYPDTKPMGYPFDRLPFGINVTGDRPRMVADLDEYVGAVSNMKAVEVTIIHTEI